MLEFLKGMNPDLNSVLFSELNLIFVSLRAKRKLLSFSHICASTLDEGIDQANQNPPTFHSF